MTTTITSIRHDEVSVVSGIMDAIRQRIDERYKRPENCPLWGNKISNVCNYYRLGGGDKLGSPSDFIEFEAFSDGNGGRFYIKMEPTLIDYKRTELREGITGSGGPDEMEASNRVISGRVDDVIHDLRGWLSGVCEAASRGKHIPEYLGGSSVIISFDSAMDLAKALNSTLKENEKIDVSELALGRA